MLQLNSVEIRGIVGSVQVGGPENNKVVRFSVATDRLFKGISGETICETTWHNVVAFADSDDKDRKDALELKRCDGVMVKGRLRNVKTVDHARGIYRETYEIVAERVELVSHE